MRASLGFLLLFTALTAHAQQRVPVAKVPAVQESQPLQRAASTASTPQPAWWGKVFFDPDRANLPLIHEVRALASGTTGFTAQLVDPQWQTLTPEDLQALPGLGDPGPAPLVRTGMGITRKRPYAMVDIEPYRRNPATGSVERLVSYRLALVEEHGAVPAQRSASYPANSKLAQGDWYRFTVPTDGVYQLTYAFLQQLGVDLPGLASDAINIYGNHAGMLPFMNTPFQPTDLLQNAIRVEDGGDGTFDPGDRILFYASGPQRWVASSDGQRFEHVKNVYSDSASYFLGIGADAPKRIGNAVLSSGPATDQVTVFNDRQVIDNDAVTVVKSGRVRFSEVFDQVTSYNYGFTLPNLDATDSTWLQVNVLGRSIGGASSFTVQAAGITRTIPISSVGTTETSPYGTYMSRLMVYRPQAPALLWRSPTTSTTRSPPWATWTTWR